MVLAHIDQVPTSRSGTGRGDVRKGQADLMQYEAKVIQTEQESERAESLQDSKAIAEPITTPRGQLLAGQRRGGQGGYQGEPSRARHGEDKPRIHGHQVAGRGRSSTAG